MDDGAVTGLGRLREDCRDLSIAFTNQFEK